MKTIYESESTPKKDGFYMPGEYEEQERTWILWPHRSDVWRCGAKPAQKVFTEIIKTVARFQPITVGVNAEDFPAVCEIFDGVENVRVIHMEYNDSWIRDPGPAFLVNDKGDVALSHFHFNAYGGFIDGLYFPWDKDASIGLQVAQLEQVNRYRPEDYILEGGSFNCDGQGTVVTTEMCLLNEDRNPQYTKGQIEEKLAEYLGIEKVIWIKDGIDPFETNGHVDDVACFSAPGEVCCMWTDDPNHKFYKECQEAYKTLSETTDARGRKLKIHKVIMPATSVYMTEEEASTWSILENNKFYRQVTIKDNVRDAYFPTIAILNEDLLTSSDFRNSADYTERLSDVMNDTDKETIDRAEQKLKEIRGNVYSFETDSGKADMISGKVLANVQWSGDAVYAMDQAEEDDFYLNWAVPKECTNLWFDGWVMLKSGVEGDSAKKQAAEAFINFLSRPDNAVRNMYYIGYTSAIAGGDSSLIYEYLDWNYGADEDETDVIEYPVGYFFAGDNSDENYVITAPTEQAKRQLSAQYPSEEEIARSAVMKYFDEEGNANINQMWINVRCFNLSMLSAGQWVAIGIGIVLVAAALLFAFRDKIFHSAG